MLSLFSWFNLSIFRLRCRTLICEGQHPIGPSFGLCVQHFVCYGYNQGIAGGLLTLDTFSEMFPQVNTLTTTGVQQHKNSTIQGK